MRIVFVGDLNPGATSLMRLGVFRELGHDITPVDYAPELIHKRMKQMWPRIRTRLGMPVDLARVNSIIKEICDADTFDLLWLEKALTVWPSTLEYFRKRQPQALVVGYSLDDMAARHNQSNYLLNGLPLYHIYFTTKSYNVPELTTMGVPVVRFTGNAFDRHTHHPMKLSSSDERKYKTDVGFVGAFEQSRAVDMLYLATQHIPVRVFGNGWWRFRKHHSNLRIEGIPLVGEDYSKAICASKINLGFLRKINRDLQTTRSIEIPACGGFMLAERTDEHLNLFEEGEEAEFFGSREEMLDKVLYYLKNDSERKRIAENGLRRCQQSCYSYHDRLKNALVELEELRAAV